MTHSWSACTSFYGRQVIHGTSCGIFTGCCEPQIWEGGGLNCLTATRWRFKAFDSHQQVGETIWNELLRVGRKAHKFSDNNLCK